MTHSAVCLYYSDSFENLSQYNDFHIIPYFYIYHLVITRALIFEQRQCIFTLRAFHHVHDNDVLFRCRFLKSSELLCIFLPRRPFARATVERQRSHLHSNENCNLYIFYQIFMKVFLMDYQDSSDENENSKLRPSFGLFLIIYYV